LLRPDVHQILCAYGVFAGAHWHPVLPTEGDIFALYRVSFLLLPDEPGRRGRVKSNIEEKGHAQSSGDPRGPVTPSVHPSEGVHRGVR